jgi:hypothetical protein
VTPFASYLAGHMIRRRTLVCLRSTLLMALALFVSPLKAEQDSSPAKAPSTKQSAPKASVLLVDTDDSCRLLIDDEDKGVITPDHSQKFNVALGEHLLKCSVEAIPDLLWRKVVDVKDTTQVVVVVPLKALHIQYNQAITKTKSQKEEADSAATKQLAEAEAAEKLREDAKAALPAQVLEMLRGKWHGADMISSLDLQVGDGFDSVTLTDKYVIAPPLLSFA